MRFGEMTGSVFWRKTCIFAFLVVFLAVALVFSAGLWKFRAEDFRHVSDLRLVAIALKCYAPVNGDYAPLLSPEPGRLMFDINALCPKYLEDPRMLLSHADPAAAEVAGRDLPPSYFTEHSSYFYLGYKVWDDKTVQAFAKAYRDRVKNGLAFDEDLPVDLPFGKLTRLNEAMRRETMIPDSESNAPQWEPYRISDSQVPYLIERPHPYPGPFGLYIGVPVPLSKPTIGGAVLYKDGHTAFIEYPGKWPMTEKTISILRSLTELARTPRESR